MRKILILLLLLCGTSYAGELEIIELKHRSAEELLPVIRPLLDKDETASGMDYRLIVRASKHNIEQIKHLVAGLDTAARQLKITVMQDVDSTNRNRLLGLSDEGISIVSTRALDSKTQQLQVTEGSKARVETGKSIAERTPFGMQYRNVTSGFYVLPRLNGNEVSIEVSTQNDTQMDDGGRHPVTGIQNLSGKVTGRLGAWIELGGTGTQENSDTSTYTSVRSSSASEHRSVLIKVDEIP